MSGDATSNRDCRITPGIFGYFIIVYAHNSTYAWAGNSWDRHKQGVPAGRSQICNFDTAQEAEEYANACGLHVVARELSASTGGAA